MSLFCRRAFLLLLVLSLIAIGISAVRKTGAASTPEVPSIELFDDATSPSSVVDSLTVNADGPQRSVIAGYG